jgi:hypothetical protein
MMIQREKFALFLAGYLDTNDSLEERHDALIDSVQDFIVGLLVGVPSAAAVTGEAIVDSPSITIVARREPVENALSNSNAHAGSTVSGNEEDALVALFGTVSIDGANRQDDLPPDLDESFESTDDNAPLEMPSPEPTNAPSLTPPMTRMHGITSLILRARSSIAVDVLHTNAGIAMNTISSSCVRLPVSFMGAQRLITLQRFDNEA